MWNFFLRNTRFTFLLIISLTLLGMFSLTQIPKESSPEVKIPYGIVTTSLPGAAAPEVETLVTNEIERGLSGSLKNVKQITSTSAEGFSSVIIEFNANVDLSKAITDLKSSVDSISPRLPKDATSPVVSEVDLNDQPVMQIAFASNRSDSEFATLAKQLEKELEAVTGVAKVEISGVRTRAVNIVINPETLTRYQLSLNEVINALASANNTFPIGQIVNNNTAYNISFDGKIKSSEEIADLPIANRGGSNIYVRDIATVDDGLAPATTISRLSLETNPAETAITINIYKTTGFDITKLTKAVNREITNLQRPGQILEGVDSFTLFDMGEIITNDLKNLSTSGLITVTLVIGVLMIAIGWREGLVAGISVPLTFMISFIALYLSGNTFNFISLFSLILGIGILVDSGIVIVEGMNRRMKDDPNIDKVAAAKLTIKDFASPVTSGTLTTVAMFAGLFVVGGIIGEFIYSIPFTLVSVLLASLLVSLGFVPLISTILLRRKNRTHLEEKQIAYARDLEIWYQKQLRTLVESPRKQKYFLRSLYLGLAVAIMMIPLGVVPATFFEAGDAEEIIIDIELPEGSLKEETDIVTRQVEEVLYQYPDTIKAFTTTIGSSNAYSGTGAAAGGKVANIFIALQDKRKLSSQQLNEQLRQKTEDIANAKIIFSELASGPPTGGAIVINLFGDDLAELSLVADNIANHLRSLDGVTNISSSNKNNSTEFVFRLDKAKAKMVGLDPQTVSATLRAAVYGTEATSLTTLEESIPVMVKLNLTSDIASPIGNTNYTTITTLENLSLSTPTGDSVPLSSLVTTSLREANSSISHQDQKRIVTVTTDVEPGFNVRQVNAQIKTELTTAEFIPNTVTLSFGGETMEADESFGDLGLALLVGLLLMLSILVIEFNSFRHTFYILAIIPFSLIGIIFGLAITGNALSFPALMGFIALTGIVVNNSILLIDSMNALRRLNPDQEISEVVIKAASGRLRPILLTTVTTVIGLVPLLFSDPIWAPLANAVMFGLTFSVIITLALVPVIYLRKPGKLTK